MQIIIYTNSWGLISRSCLFPVPIIRLPLAYYPKSPEFRCVSCWWSQFFAYSWADFSIFGGGAISRPEVAAAWCSATFPPIVCWRFCWRLQLCFRGYSADNSTAMTSCCPFRSQKKNFEAPTAKWLGQTDSSHPAGMGTKTTGAGYCCPWAGYWGAALGAWADSLSLIGESNFWKSIWPSAWCRKCAAPFPWPPFALSTHLPPWSAKAWSGTSQASANLLSGNQLDLKVAALGWTAAWGVFFWRVFWFWSPRLCSGRIRCSDNPRASARNLGRFFTGRSPVVSFALIAWLPSGHRRCWLAIEICLPDHSFLCLHHLISLPRAAHWRAWTSGSSSAAWGSCPQKPAIGRIQICLGVAPLQWHSDRLAHRIRSAKGKGFTISVCSPSTCWFFFLAARGRCGLLFLAKPISCAPGCFLPQTGSEIYRSPQRNWFRFFRSLPLPGSQSGRRADPRTLPLSIFFAGAHRCPLLPAPRTDRLCVESQFAWQYPGSAENSSGRVSGGRETSPAANRLCCTTWSPYTGRVCILRRGTCWNHGSTTRSTRTWLPVPWSFGRFWGCRGESSTSRNRLGGLW